jgi:hypothetical protein
MIQCPVSNSTTRFSGRARSPSIQAWVWNMTGLRRA